LTLFPPIAIDVDATLYPREFSAISGNELKHIRMVEIKMKDNSSVLVNTTTPQDFIEG
jgi:hypothetical protein